MPVAVTPANKITLMVGTETIECQVVSHTVTDADPGGGDKLRTGCGDVVVVPADATDVGTIDLTLIPERGVTGFVAWTWANAGQTVTFELVVNPSESTAYQWSGELTMAAISEQQEEYGKTETVDVTWNVTSWTDRAAAVAAA